MVFNNIMKIITILIIILIIILLSIFMNYIDNRSISVQSSHVSGESSGSKDNKLQSKNDNDKIENKITPKKSVKVSPTATPTTSVTITLAPTAIAKAKPTDNPVVTPSQVLIEESDIKSEDGNNEGIIQVTPTPTVTKSGDKTLLNVEVNIDNDKSIKDTVISSTTETSNQEKQEVLNELDKALQGLLEVVGKVPTVDETKLNASLESEVQP